MNKMNTFIKSKIGMSIAAMTAVVTVFSAGALAGNGYREVTAVQNSLLNITVDGKAINLNNNGEAIYPLVFGERTYVPARALAEALNASVDWDPDTETVVVTTNKGVSPYPTKDASSNNPAPAPSKPAPSKPAASSHTAKPNDPVPVGESFTYYENVNFKPGEYDTRSVTYTVTVNGSRSISASEIEKLGYRIQSGSSYLEVDLSVKVKDATFKKGTGGLGYTLLGQFVPTISGTVTSSGDGLLGGIDHFAGSLGKQAIADSGNKKMTDGDVFSYETRGKVIVPVVAGETNYLIIRNKSTDLSHPDNLLVFELE